MNTIRRRLRDRDRQAGMTVVELSISMVITSILMVCIGTVTMSTLRIVRTQSIKTNIAADSRIGLEATTRTMRAAIIPDGETSAIVYAAGDAVTFYSQINRANAIIGGEVIPSKVEYYQGGNCLYEAVTPPRQLATAATAGPFYAWDTGRTVKCLLRTWPNANLFTYYSSPSNPTVITIPVSGSLIPDDMEDVRSIEMVLTVVDPQNRNVAGIQMKSRVTLDNVVLAAGGTV